MNNIELFFVLIAGHYLADYALQTEFMAVKKGRAFIEATGFFALTAHAAIHGLVAGVIARNFWVGIIVVITHWLIDYGKASELITDKFPHTKGARKQGQKFGLYGIVIDQMLHMLVLLAVVLWLRPIGW